ncbi:DUF2163 domain-containing protein [Burkholderia sp. WTPI3]|uniref:DUF2163 domain-containing protein n=1 Tax=Burkholderia sp. WTPI3 TaxID=2822167 RepID=UPI002285CA0F|nr:DUF2163 domain-containing protein [Burkholderia sp. WTPI3]
MRSIPSALVATLESEVQTVCTLWQITRTDGQVFAFTDLDQPVTYGGLTYQSAGGYTHSQIENTSDLSTSNLEVQAVFDSSAITQASLESGQWDFAQVTCMLVDYTNPSAGAVTLASGTLGQVTITNGAYQVEMRGVAQLMQQEQGDVYSPTCRAQLGDAKCMVNLTSLTFNGTVASVSGATSWSDPGLTQTGPVVAYSDTTGHKIPTRSPFTVQVVPPNGGAFVSTISVVDSYGTTYSVGTGSGQYTVSATGLYTFNSAQAGGEIFISYNYTVGYFAFGKVKWLTGQNAGFVMEVKSFTPGTVTLAMAMPFPVTVGDTYTITAGCDKQLGTCYARYNNIVHFRGEPFIPGPDLLLSPQGN